MYCGKKQIAGIRDTIFKKINLDFLYLESYKLEAFINLAILERPKHSRVQGFNMQMLK